MIYTEQVFSRKMCAAAQLGRMSEQVRFVCVSVCCYSVAEMKTVGTTHIHKRARTHSGYVYILKRYNKPWCMVKNSVTKKYDEL